MRLGLETLENRGVPSVVTLTSRLAELPGKCKMTVKGAYGDWRPITVTYADKNASSGTVTLVFNSVDGHPWTQGDQDSYNAKNKLAPAPREKKP